MTEVRRPVAEPRRQTRAEAKRSSRNYRLVAAWGMGVLLSILAVSVGATATSLTGYVQATFFAVVIIGLGMAIYIGTRAND